MPSLKRSRNVEEALRHLLPVVLRGKCLQSLARRSCSSTIGILHPSASLFSVLMRFSDLCRHLVWNCSASLK